MGTEYYCIRKIKEKKNIFELRIVVSATYDKRRPQAAGRQQAHRVRSMRLRINTLELLMEIEN